MVSDPVKWPSSSALSTSWGSFSKYLRPERHTMSDVYSARSTLTLEWVAVTAVP